MKRPNISMKAVIIIAALLAAMFLIGRYSGSKRPDEHAAHTEASEATSWTCSMHPQIDQPEPGKCPLCGMDLIPRKGSGGEDLGERMMSMSKAAMKLAEVRTAPVERKFVDLEIPMVGRVDYDETRVRTISAWTAGRLDRLFVDYTGIPVKKGDHLVEIYSPELYTAQEELLQAIKSEKEVEGSGNESIQRTAKATILAVREKLRLLGLSADQISAIERQEAPSTHTEITAPIGGIVIHKNAKEGMYVKTGTPIYTVADLSMLWVRLDAYESDLAWIKYGQKVDVRTETFGDRVFRGWISFIDPILDPKTRTVKVRVVVKNESGLLRPNMFVRATVKARVGEEDVVLTSNLDGQWICPMHPEVVKDKAGDCDVCGMDLVQAEQIGYVSSKEVKEPIVVPASAVLITGKRAIVYRKLLAKEKPTFEGVQIEIGPRAGNYYIVRSGLEEGEHIVVNGNFKIDSALQLMAKSSMMSADDGPPMKMIQVLSVSAEFLSQLNPVYASYLDAQTALADDNAETALKSLAALKSALAGVDMALLKGDAHKRWMEFAKELNASLAHVQHLSEIADVRELFIRLSSAMIDLEQTVGHAGDEAMHQAFCSMANDGRGANWLQLSKEIRNPFYGASMLSCGEIKQSFPSKTPRKKPAELTPETQKAVADLTTAYFAVQGALTKDNSEHTKHTSMSLAKLAREVSLADTEKEPLGKMLQEIIAASEKLAAEPTIQKQREQFAALSTNIERLLEVTGPPAKTKVYKAYCPMAFGNKGGTWLQAGKEVMNPYFGSTMLHCGEVQGLLGKDADKEDKNESR